MKFKFSDIIINYLDSFNLFEHLCIVVAFLEFIFFLIPWNPPLDIHILLLLALPLIMQQKSRIPEKYKKLIKIFCFIIFFTITNITLPFFNLSVGINWNLPIIITVSCILGSTLSLYMRKDKKATIKSLIIIGAFSILFSLNFLYNNKYYISNPQLRNHLHSTIISKRCDEELVLDITSLNIGDSSNINNLKDIEKFKNLKRIYVDGYVRNIEGLFKLEKLVNIGFWFSDSNILYEINKFETLKSLTLDYVPSIKKDFILSDIPNLEELYISGNYIGHVDFIGKLNNLQLLELNRMDLENVDTIKNLKSLKVLKLYKVNISDIDGILSNDSIEEIHYINSNIMDYEEVLKEKGIKLVRKR